MPSSYPSIKTFYKPEIKTAAPPSSLPESTQVGDGFTEEELHAAQDPTTREWNPEREYTEHTISSLTTGPSPVTFSGRVVNFTTIRGTSQKEKSAAGWHYLLLKDDTGVISVLLTLPKLTS